MPDREIESKQKRVRWLVDKVLDGNIKIPDFQRAFVWKVDQVIKLLDSVYNDYPIGSILLWETQKELNSLRNVGGIKLPEPRANYPVNYVLDGQQRLSTLFGVLHHGSEEYERESGNVGVEEYDKFDIYFDTVRESFIHSADVPNIDSKDVDTGRLFEEREDLERGRYIKMNTLRRAEIYYRQLEGIPDDRVEIAHNLFNKFENYQVPIVTVKGREKSEVGTIFERINNTGTDLDTLDLMIAWTWSSDFDLRKEIDKILDIASERGFGEIDKKRILQCISAITVERISTDDILESLKQPEKIESIVKRVRDSLKRAIDFLVEEFNVYDLKFLPSSFQIIPLVYLFSEVDTLSTSQVDSVKRWFWRISFGTRYRDATNQRVRDDISFFKDLSRDESQSPEEFDVDVASPNFFSSTKFHSRASATKAFVLMLTQKEPRDLLTGEKIRIGTTLSNYRKSEYHHVFPRSYLKGRGYSTSIVNSLSNRCLIKSNSNKKIGSNPPSEYLFNQSGRLFDTNKDIDTKKEILRSNLLPTDLDIYKKDDFESFIEKRTEILYSYIHNFI
jgi:hypothetical protein